MGFRRRATVVGFRRRATVVGFIRRAILVSFRSAMALDIGGLQTENVSGGQ